MKQNRRYEVDWVFDGGIKLRCPLWPETSVRVWLDSHYAKRRLLNPTRRILAYNSEKQLAEWFGELRDLGFVFCGGCSGWPPSAIFEELRDKEMLEGNFIEVTSSGSRKKYVEK